MITEISIQEIEKQLIIQLNSVFLISESEKEEIAKRMDEVLGRCERCFKEFSIKYYRKDGEVYFNPYHSAQYTTFLFYFSNSVYKGGNRLLADKLYYLNKMMNACDLFYEVDLPDYFILDHPVGTVMGRAVYGNGFNFSQNCTVGNNRGVYPVIGEHVKMCVNSSIIGDCRIGNRVILGADCTVKDEDIPDDCIVFGQSPNLIIKKKN